MISGLVLLFIIFFGLTLPLLVDGEPIDQKKLFGLISFWLIGIIVTLAPFGFRLEIGDNYVKTSFLGFCTRNLLSSNVQSVEYGSLLRGGLGAGKGLKGWEKIDGKSKYFSIEEKFWGKEAIEHAKKSLRMEG